MPRRIAVAACAAGRRNAGASPRCGTLARWRIWVLVAAAVPACTSPGKGKTAFVGATLFDGTGAPPVRDAVVIVAGGRIERAGPAGDVPVPKGATQIPAAGKWIVPGLIDAHAQAPRWTLPRFLAYGVTSVRDLGTPEDSAVALRAASASGTVDGPRLYISGAPIDGPGGSGGGTVVARAADARRAIGQRVLFDAAQAMLMPRLDAALLAPLMDEAKMLKIPVAAHLGRVDALTAARAGVSSVELLSGVVQASAPAPQALVRAYDDPLAGWRTSALMWADLDSATLDRTARALAETRVTLVPGLIRHATLARLTDSSFEAGIDLSAVPDSVRDGWDIPGLVRRAGWGEAEFAAFRRARPRQDLFVRLFARAGGRIAAGTGTPGALLAPGASLHDELELLVAAGLAPKEALLAATREAARVLRADSIGAIRPGMAADFVVLDGDPLADIANTRKIDIVVSGGSVFRPNVLRSGW